MHDATHPPAVGLSDRYVPLVETLRLYAGWLLAWYGVVFLLGGYQQVKDPFPLNLSLLESLLSSGVLLVSAFGAYLFLLFTSVHRWCGRRVLVGFALSVLWLLLTWAYAVNVR
jgi:hypothetical protein